jgi:anti-sigma-K factor RskA
MSDQPMNHDELRLLVSAHAIHALDPEDARALDAHMATCAECSAAFADALETASLLALASGAATPPPGLRERILVAARADAIERLGPQEARPATVQPAEPEPEPEPEAAVPATAPPRRRRERAPFRPWFGFLTPARTWASAMTLAAAAAAFIAFTSTQDLDDLRNKTSGQSAALGELARPGARVVSMTADGSAGGAALLLAANKQPTLIVNIVNAPVGRTYQLWAIDADGAAPRSLGTFEGGNGVAVPLNQALGAAVTIAVTLEPEGGSPAPTTTPFLVGDLN